MIAGKKYDGLMVDVWSCGIVLYAMLCGYLPFEDPDTKKLYKKILKGHFELPKFLSDSAKDILKKILNTNPDTRYKISDIRSHPWYSLCRPKELHTETLPINASILSMLKDFQIDPEVAKKHLEANRHNDVTATYYLLLRKYKKMEAPLLGKCESDGVRRVGEIENKPLNSTTETAHTIQNCGLEEKSKVSWTEKHKDEGKRKTGYKITPEVMFMTNANRAVNNVTTIQPVFNKTSKRTASQSANREIQKSYFTDAPKNGFAPRDNLSLIPEVANKYHKWPLEVLADGNFQPRHMQGIYRKVISQVRAQPNILIRPIDRASKVPKSPVTQKVNLSDYATRRTNRFGYSRRTGTGVRQEMRLQSRKGTANRSKRISETRHNDRTAYAKAPLTSTVINFNAENLPVGSVHEATVRNFRMRKYKGMNNRSIGN